ncbi:MAG: glycosyltransferase [Paracoccaceae bacterium]|nr:glycosyltransferase [Paracoccaceae bacterium]
MAVQVLGLCRFSYLAEGGFKVQHDALADRRHLLYDPARLALRFLWFERICLPCWAAQTDPDFRLIVLTGTDFPKSWLERLFDVTAAIPQIKVVQEDPGPHRDVCRRVLRRNVDPAARVVAQFRHDDDDAVAVDYVARCRSDYRQKLRPLFRAHPLISVDYSRGMTLNAQAGEVEVLPQITHNLGVALTLYMPPEFPNSVMNFAHHRLAGAMPGVSFQDSVMYLRGRHGANDSGDSARMGFPYPMPEPDQPTILRERFGIDLPDFRAKISDMNRLTV